MWWLLWLAPLLVHADIGRWNYDHIDSLPGITFDYPHQQASGFLNASTADNNASFHYWYLDAQSSPQTAPLVVWLTGGPGCSSTGALLNEIGPFRATDYGQYLFENTYAWNKVANLLVIDAPEGAGFSRVTSAVEWTDAMVGDAVANAVLDFLNNVQAPRGYPATPKVFIAGEGYGSLYVVNTYYSLLQKLDAKETTIQLQGALIGNGLLSKQTQYNALVNFVYTRNLAGQNEWDSLRGVCCMAQSPLDCDYYSWHTSTACRQKADALVNKASAGLNNFNIYEDCYQKAAIQQQLAWNYNSTDAFGGWPCEAESSTHVYLNRNDVVHAIHVRGEWKACSNVTYKSFAGVDLSSQLVAILKHRLYTEMNMKMLIYNGDLDLAQNFLGASWFIAKMADAAGIKAITTGTQWKFGLNKALYQQSVGGMVQRYEHNLDVLTVKGAGHFVPTSRPGQMLQVLNNFIANNTYDTDISSLNVAAAPIFPRYQKNHTSDRKMADKITDLPGVNFPVHFNQYSGYLAGSDGNSRKLHYWLVESQSSPSTDPLLLWMNGGPGESSLMGMFSETGPFRPSKDAQTITENPYSWNKFANVLYLESPRGVGFSYETDNGTTYDDDETAEENSAALRDFFTVFPEYKNRPFYLTGEAYAGVYLPMLAKSLIFEIGNGYLPINLKGLILGNPWLSGKQQVNSVINQLYFSGIVGYDEFNELTSQCCPNNTDVTTCDFSYYVTFTDKPIIPVANNATNEECSKKVLSIVSDRLWNTANDPYNLYQDCYNMKNSSMNVDVVTGNAFVDEASRWNVESTDALGGFPCWGTAAMNAYLQRADVRRALHIPDIVPPFSDFNDNISNLYKAKYTEMDKTLTDVMRSYYYRTTNMSILLYSGNIDAACSHLGTQWFIEKLAEDMNLELVAKRKWWTYANQPTTVPVSAGFVKQWSSGLSWATVFGAGHMVSMDRPGPALQMLYNHLHGQDFSTLLPFVIAPQPLLPAYLDTQNCTKQYILGESETFARNEPSQSATVLPPLTDRAAADQIIDLPGLTWNITFRQFAGYLTPASQPKHHLFYWFVESQNDPANDPVIMWMNGGPGCSSVGNGLFEENGPFHANNDNGTTLFENVYSWNKKANVLFMEGPVGVGYSYSEDGFFPNNDDSTADDNAGALVDFFTNVFPTYALHEFFLTGESYAGVYAPTLSLRLLNLIDAGTLHLNFKGLAIGNGILSEYLQFNSQLALQYGHGFTQQSDWKRLSEVCCPGTNTYKCDFGAAANNSACYRLSNALENFFYYHIMDPYNINQACYSMPLKHQAKHARKRRALANGRLYEQPKNSGFTDPFDGIYCWVDDSVSTYLNRKDVQDAIHAKDMNHGWLSCADEGLGFLYKTQAKYYDMSETFHSILSTTSYVANKFRILLYNGDVDTICQFLGDQWWIEAFAQQRNLEITLDYQPWYYSLPGANIIPQIAGYVKKFRIPGQPDNWFDMMTVKGSGHMVPMDRPGPAIQMIYNFVFNVQDYSQLLDISTTRSPLLPQYASPQPGQCSRADSDRIATLPGLPVTPSFDQFSGYLKTATEGEFLHYWFVESQADPATSPLLLWLNGGPGASSLEGLFFENGPFAVNQDGQTLSVNPESWNMFANVLYLENPVFVGYSYGKNITNASWDDDKTTKNAFAALQDFFTIFPQYQKNAFYTTGESYGGVYLPLLADKLIAEIGRKTITCNYKGLIIGNGELSKADNLNSKIHLAYYMGQLATSNYKEIISECCAAGSDEFKCDFASHVHFTGPIISGNSSDPCYQKVLNFLTVFEYMPMNDPYNMYEDCYTKPQNGDDAYIQPDINFNSSDPWGARYCWQAQALSSYLSLESVRNALHIPAQVQKWNEYSDTILYLYNQMNVDMAQTVTNIINSDYYSSSGFSILIMAGDADTMCNGLGNEWFIERVETGVKANVKLARAEWTYQQAGNLSSVVAGWWKQFDNRVTYATVKGAGHMVPMDRPAPALQIVYNFIAQRDFSTPFDYHVLPPTTTPNVPTFSTSPSNNLTTTTPSNNSTNPSTTTTTTTPVPTTTKAVAAVSSLLAIVMTLFV